MVFSVRALVINQAVCLNMILRTFFETLVNSRSAGIYNLAFVTVEICDGSL